LTSTREALLTYLRVDPQPVALYAIKKYLYVMFHVKHSATREMLRRLCREDLIERVGRGIYRAKTGMDVEAPAEPGIAPGLPSLNKAAPTDHTLVSIVHG
jgi:hypothetical protein